jgi:hypothetical protein
MSERDETIFHHVVLPETPVSQRYRDPIRYGEIPEIAFRQIERLIGRRLRHGEREMVTNQIVVDEFRRSQRELLGS